MHPDDLRVVWRCHDCGRSFVFNSDADDHVREFDHKMETLEITSKKSGRLEAFTDSEASIVFKIDDRRVAMKVRYRYYPRTGAISYADVIYSEVGLRERVENDDGMMRMIDDYLRSLVEKTGAHSGQDQGIRH